MVGDGDECGFFASLEIALENRVKDEATEGSCDEGGLGEIIGN